MNIVGFWIHNMEIKGLYKVACLYNTKSKLWPFTGFPWGLEFWKNHGKNCGHEKKSFGIWLSQKSHRKISVLNDPKRMAVPYM